MNDPHETKKRSLSSYLSNVGSRREELEKLKQRQLEERQKQEEKERQRQQELELTKDNLREKGLHEKGLKTDEGLRDNMSKQIEKQEEMEHTYLEKEEEEKKHTISRVELHSILKGPKETSHDDEDMASDAPTEPASPPKPRRGKLIRGDKLTSITPRQVSFDNESDSELSDIDELGDVNISSSVLHGDSSPMKRYSTPRKVSKSSKLHRKGIYRDAGGRTRLQIACDKGNLEIAKRLIEEDGYDVNDQDNAGTTALHEAALNGHLDVVKLLVEHGANVNIQSYEMFQDTPLIDASTNGHLPVVKFLLEHGSDPLVCNSKGLTAYDAVDEEADLDDDEREIVREIQKCLREASKRALDRTPTKDTPSMHGRHSEDDYEFYWKDITSRAGREKLLRASKEGKLAYVGAYLENGGKVDVKSFFEAVKFGHEDIASLYLAFGAPVDVSLRDGTTSLMAAVGRGHQGVVKLLLEADADPTKRDKMGHDALYYAKNGPLGIIDTEEIQRLKDAIKKHSAAQPDNANSNKRRKLEGVEVDPDSRKQESMEPELMKQGSLEPESKAHTELDLEESKETPDEREARMKAEEEYVQRRIQNKKKKEQELLKKLALDERKREEEKQKQRLQELEKIEADKRQLESHRRRAIRSMYPLGLKLVNFKLLDDFESFLPLYYVNFNREKYVLDLQVCVLLKDSDVIDPNAQPVKAVHKEQLWNLLSFIFLKGGRENELNFGSMSLAQRIDYQSREFAKFSHLPLHWIPYESVQCKLGPRRQVITNNMVEILLVDGRPVSQEKERRPLISPITLNDLPPRFHHRNGLLESINLQSGPSLW